MRRYSKYFLQHSLWLEDEFCRYYVQDDVWGRPPILDVHTLIFNWDHEAEQWIEQCAAYDDVFTIHRLREFLADHCLEPFNLHRMNNRQVMRAAARQLSDYALRVVVEPRFGWAVRIDEQTAEPALPVTVESAPELAHLRAELKVHLDALVAEQQKNYDRHEAELAQLSTDQKALYYGQNAGDELYDATIGGVVDLAKAFPGFYVGYLKTLWKIARLPSQMAQLTAHGILTGDYNPLEQEINKIVDPVAQTYEQAVRYKSMLTILFSDQETYEMLYDFAQRYWAATHPVERTRMGISAVSDIVVTIVLALISCGIGAAANVAAKSTRLVKIAKLLEKITTVLRRIGPRTGLLEKGEEAAAKLGRAEKRTAKAVKEVRKAEADVKKAERAAKIEKEAQKEYDAIKTVEGSEKAPNKKKPKTAQEESVEKHVYKNKEFPTTTKPSGQRGGKPFGERTTNKPNASSEYKRSIKKGKRGG